MQKVFLVLAQSDATLGAELAALIETALPECDLICPQLPGYAEEDDRSWWTAHAVVGLVSEAALVEASVPFELGGAHAVDKPVFAVLGAHIVHEALAWPIPDKHVGQLTDGVSMARLLGRLADALGVSPQLDDVYAPTGPALDAQPELPQPEETQPEAPASEPDEPESWQTTADAVTPAVTTASTEPEPAPAPISTITVANDGQADAAASAVREAQGASTGATDAEPARPAAAAEASVDRAEGPLSAWATPVAFESPAAQSAEPGTPNDGISQAISDALGNGSAQSVVTGASTLVGFDAPKDEPTRAAEDPNDDALAGGDMATDPTLPQRSRAADQTQPGWPTSAVRQTTDEDNDATALPDAPDSQAPRAIPSRSDIAPAPSVLTAAPGCEASMEAGRAFADCIFHREDGGSFTEELDIPFGNFVTALGGNWNTLRALDDIDMWMEMADNVLSALPDERYYVRLWYEVGFQLATLLNLANLDESGAGSSDIDDTWAEAMSALVDAAGQLGMGAGQVAVLEGMLENLRGPSSERDYLNVGRVESAIRQQANHADAALSA